MTDKLEKRCLVMRRSIALGHCICDPHLACPCNEFKNDGVCHCAGERRPDKCFWMPVPGSPVLG